MIYDINFLIFGRDGFIHFKQIVDRFTNTADILLNGADDIAHQIRLPCNGVYGVGNRFLAVICQKCEREFAFEGKIEFAV